MWKNSILICEYNQVVSVHIRIHKYMIYQITPHQIYVIISRFCGQEPGRRALLDRDMDGRCEVYLAVASFSYFWLVNYYLILHRPPISSPASNPTLSIFCWFSLTKSWVEEHDDSAHLISWFPIRHNSQVLIFLLCNNSVCHTHLMQYYNGFGEGFSSIFDSCQNFLTDLKI